VSSVASSVVCADTRPNLAPRESTQSLTQLSSDVPGRYVGVSVTDPADTAAHNNSFYSPLLPRFYEFSDSRANRINSSANAFGVAFASRLFSVGLFRDFPR